MHTPDLKKVKKFSHTLTNICRNFKKIIPNDYKRMMMLSAQMEDKGLSSEQAQIEAFYESMRK